VKPGSTGSGPKAFEAKGNDVLVTGHLMASVLLLLASVVVLAFGWPGATPRPFRGLPHEAWGVLGILTFGWGTLWSSRFLFDREPRLRISAEGILNRTYWTAPILIPWTEVVEIRSKGLPGVREVVLRDPTSWLVHQPRTVRAWAWITRLFGLGPVPLNLWALAATWDEVDEQLEAGLERFELEAYFVACRDPSIFEGREAKR